MHTGKSWVFILILGVSIVAWIGGCIRPLSPVSPTPPNPTFTATPSPTNTGTASATPLFTSTASLAPTSTATATATQTLTSTASDTATAAATSTFSATATFSQTPSPSETSTVTPHLTPTIPAAPPSGIFWPLCEIYLMNHTTNQASSLFMLSVNGAVETTCAVTLTTPSGNVPFAYSGPSSYPNYAIYSPTTPILYQPGGTYTMTTITSIGTATASLTAPGGGVSISPDGLTTSWNVEGNEDYLNIKQTGGGYTYQSINYTMDLDSPFSVPASAYPAPGSYYVWLAAENTNYNVTGAAPGSYFMLTDLLSGPLTIN